MGMRTDLNALAVTHESAVAPHLRGEERNHERRGEERRGIKMLLMLSIRVENEILSGSDCDEG